MEMRNISMGLVFKYHYREDVDVEEEFQQAREEVDYVDVPNSLKQSRLRHTHL